MATWLHDPDAKLDYGFDWMSWLDEDETIDEFTVTAPTPDEDDEDALVVTDETEVAGVVTFWVAGGEPGADYRIGCRIETSAGRTDERSITIRVRHR